MNASLKFYYLTEEIESTGYEAYQGGGWIGFTPNSWNTDMGLFHLFKNMIQSSEETKLRLYSMPHTIGLQMHPVHETGFNYLTIGGVAEDVVTDKNQINWIHTSSKKHWEISI